MDIIFIVIGIVLVIVGANKKDKKGTRTGTGISLLTIGIVLLIIGVLWFSISFINGFTKSYNQSQRSPVLNKVNDNSYPIIVKDVPVNQYPEIYEQNFMFTCMRDAGGENSRSYCQCAINEIKKEYTYEQALQFDRQYLSTKVVPPELIKVGEKCIK